MKPYKKFVVGFFFVTFVIKLALFGLFIYALFCLEQYLVGTEQSKEQVQLALKQFEASSPGEITASLMFWSLDYIYPIMGVAALILFWLFFTRDFTLMCFIFFFNKNSREEKWTDEVKRKVDRTARRFP